MRALPHIAALVHRFLTYLSRVCKSRLSKKLIKKFWVFRLATMFYAPVNRLPVQRVVITACAHLRELLKVRRAEFDLAFGYFLTGC